MSSRKKVHMNIVLYGKSEKGERKYGKFILKINKAAKKRQQMIPPIHTAAPTHQNRSQYKEINSTNSIITTFDHQRS